MKIPTDAVISHKKLTQYLLVFKRKNDKSLFLAQAGFTQKNPGELEAALRNLLATNQATADRQNEYGTFFQVKGDLYGPTGKLHVTTVWIQQKESAPFRFITLKPTR